MEREVDKQAAGPIGPHTKCQRKAEVVHSSVGDTILALNVDTGDSYSFDGPSGRIWELLESPASPATIATILSREFEIDEEECAKQVRSYCNRLMEEEIIVIADSGD